MLGILFAFGALCSWMFGDFFIQKSSRCVGIWKSLFFISFIGAIGIFPFIKNEIPSLIFNIEALELFMFAAIVALFASLFDFEALKEGKFSIIEPLIGLELPFTIGLSVLLGGEKFSLLQFILMFLTFIGIILAVTTRRKIVRHKHFFEKGVIFAGLGAIGMALMNFLIGHASQETSALATIWFVHSLIAIMALVYLIGIEQLHQTFLDIKAHFAIVAPESILDNLAWIFYALATTYIPISLTTTISESYIVGGVLLGFFVNRERLRLHQLIGVFLTIGSILFLTAIAG